MPSLRSALRVLLLAAIVARPAGLHAQAGDTVRGTFGGITPLVSIGSPEEDRFRLQQVLGRAPTDGFLIRSPSSQTPALPMTKGGLRWSLVAPEVEAAWNSEMPFSLNDGRYNYLFQNPEHEPEGREAIDMQNSRLRLTLVPTLGRIHR
ncbi:MAG: hypothetical protein M3P24_10280 [Gemmatimonadota bacterium]|nr:hypothetical protein [Gemmatimonadota bacterium]